MSKYKKYVNQNNGYEVEIKDGFHWSGLFFNIFYLIYNKLIIQTIIYLLLAIIFGVFTGGIGSLLIPVIIGFKASDHLESKYIDNGYMYDSTKNYH